MKYKAKNKNLGKIKFILTVLVLSGGLLVATKMVQTNQENRSNAAFVADGGGGMAPNYVVGTAIRYNTHMCGDILRGRCADFGKVYREGTYCKVGTIYGKIREGFCSGGEYIRCCARVF